MKDIFISLSKSLRKDSKIVCFYGVSSTPPSNYWPHLAVPLRRFWTPHQTTLQVILNGELTVYGEGPNGRDEWILNAGDILYVEGGCWTMRRNDSDRELLSIVCGPENLALDHFVHRSGPTSAPSIGGTQHIKASASLLHLINALKTATPSALSHIIRSIFYSISDQVILGRGSPAPQALVESAIRWLRPRLKLGVGRNEVARAMGYSPDHLTKIFKESGEGFQMTLDRLRMELAREMLMERKNSIEAIARNCGLSSTQQFIAVFKRCHGQTPGAWRLRGQLMG